jgi:hypothetical protein
MSVQTFILFATDAEWQVCAVAAGRPSFAEVSIPADATPQQRAANATTALQSLGHAGEPVILAIPSSWCYAASISVDDLPKGDRKAMTYRLEEKLPLAAESLIVDFVFTDDSAQKVLGICVAADLLKDLVDALEAGGVAVQAITPIVLLAAQGLGAIEGQDPHVLLCGEAGSNPAQLSVLACENGKPSSWALLPAEVGDVKLQLEVAALEGEGSPHVEACGLDPDLVDELTEATGLIVTVRDGQVAELAARFGDEVLSGRQRPWVDFRRGQLAIQDPLRLYRRSLNALAASAAILLIVSAAVMIWRGVRYAHAANTADAQMVEAFRKQFPGWAVPANVRAVIESEHRKATARAGESLPPEATRSALQTMRDVLDKLPAEGRFTLDRVTFEDQGFEMEGRLRSYEDVDAVAAAGRRAGLNVDPPQTHKDGQGFWSFTIRGVRPAKSGPAVGGGVAG